MVVTSHRGHLRLIALAGLDMNMCCGGALWLRSKISSSLFHYVYEMLSLAAKTLSCWLMYVLYLRAVEMNSVYADLQHIEIYSFYSR